MTIEKMSVTLITSKIEQVRGFYESHFKAKAIFDCGWYVALELPGSDKAEICLMAPREEEGREFSGGTTINLKVEDVDALHEELTKTDGLTFVMQLEDQPWGDRSFAVLDPAGCVVYCYRNIEPTEEFKQYYIKE